MLQTTRHNRRNWIRPSRLRIFVQSAAILATVAMTSFFLTAAGECSEFETEPHKDIALVRADDGVAHGLETRDGAFVSEAPLSGNSKLESAIGI